MHNTKGDQVELLSRRVSILLEKALQRIVYHLMCSVNTACTGVPFCFLTVTTHRLTATFCLGPCCSIQLMHPFISMIWGVVKRSKVTWGERRCYGSACTWRILTVLLEGIEKIAVMRISSLCLHFSSASYVYVSVQMESHHSRDQRKWIWSDVGWRDIATTR